MPMPGGIRRSYRAGRIECSSYRTGLHLQEYYYIDSQYGNKIREPFDSLSAEEESGCEFSAFGSWHQASLYRILSSFRQLTALHRTQMLYPLAIVARS